MLAMALKSPWLGYVFLLEYSSLREEGVVGMVPSGVQGSPRLFQKKDGLLRLHSIEPRNVTHEYNDE